MLSFCLSCNHRLLTSCIDTFLCTFITSKWKRWIMKKKTKIYSWTEFSRISETIDFILLWYAMIFNRILKIIWKLCDRIYRRYSCDKLSSDKQPTSWNANDNNIRYVFLLTAHTPVYMISKNCKESCRITLFCKLLFPLTWANPPRRSSFMNMHR